MRPSIVVGLAPHHASWNVTHTLRMALYCNTVINKLVYWEAYYSYFRGHCHDNRETWKCTYIICQNYEVSTCFIYVVIDSGSVLRVELLWKVLKTSMLSKKSSYVINNGMLVNFHVDDNAVPHVSRIYLRMRIAWNKISGMTLTFLRGMRDMRYAICRMPELIRMANNHLVCQTYTTATVISTWYRCRSN